jgi:hypothetical protein
VETANETFDAIEHRRSTLAAAQAAIRFAMEAPRGSGMSRTALQVVISQDREVFFEAALALLQEMPEARKRPAAYARICEQPAFLRELVRPERFTLARLIQVCGQIIQYDKRLDIRLAALLPGRYEDRHQLPPLTIVRVLDVLNEISVGPRLILPLSHLTDYAEPAVAERAVVLLGRRIRNSAWPHRRLSSTEEGVRAGAVEALWGIPSPAACAAMWNCVSDHSPRVVGNAIFGLHLLGEAGVDQLVSEMIHDARALFRSTAAKVAGKIGKQEFAALLQQAAADADPGVRLAVKRALGGLRRALRQQVQAAQPPAAQIEAPPAPERPRPAEFKIKLDGRRTSTR